MVWQCTCLSYELALQPAFWVPPSCCFCCSETQKTCLTSCHWEARAQWHLAWEEASVFQLWLSTPVEARWKIVTAVTEERLCGETTWFHEFETMITRNREDLNSKTRNLLEQSGSGMLESKWYLVPYRISRCSLNSNRKVSFYASPRKPFCSAQYSFYSVMVGLGSEEVASLKMDSETSLATFTSPLEWGLWDVLYRVKGLSLLGDKTQDCFHVEMCINTSDGKWSGRLYSAAAETDQPLLCPQKHKRQESIFPCHLNYQSIWRLKGQHIHANAREHSFQNNKRFQIL